MSLRVPEKKHLFMCHTNSVIIVYQKYQDQVDLGIKTPINILHELNKKIKTNNKKSAKNEHVDSNTFNSANFPSKLSSSVKNSVKLKLEGVNTDEEDNQTCINSHDEQQLPVSQSVSPKQHDNINSKLTLKCINEFQLQQPHHKRATSDNSASVRNSTVSSMNITSSSNMISGTALCNNASSPLRSRCRIINIEPELSHSSCNPRNYPKSTLLPGDASNKINLVYVGGARPSASRIDNTCESELADDPPTESSAEHGMNSLRRVNIPMANSIRANY